MTVGVTFAVVVGVHKTEQAGADQGAEVCVQPVRSCYKEARVLVRALLHSATAKGAVSPPKTLI